MTHPSNVAHKELDFYSNTISQHMQTWDRHTDVLWACVDSNNILVQFNIVATSDVSFRS